MISSPPSVERTTSLDKSLVAVVLAGICTSLEVYNTQPLLPFLQTIFHASEATVSLTVSAKTLGIAVSAPVIGLLAESIGRRKVIVPALFGLTVPTFLAATAHTLGALLFWRFLQGLIRSRRYRRDDHLNRRRMGGAPVARDDFSSLLLF